jgi:hypothetical protein
MKMRGGYVQVEHDGLGFCLAEVDDLISQDDIVGDIGDISLIRLDFGMQKRNVPDNPHVAVDQDIVADPEISGKHDDQAVDRADHIFFEHPGKPCEKDTENGQKCPDVHMQIRKHRRKKGKIQNQAGYVGNADGQVVKVFPVEFVPFSVRRQNNDFAHVAGYIHGKINQQNVHDGTQRGLVEPVLVKGVKHVRYNEKKGNKVCFKAVSPGDF